MAGRLRTARSEPSPYATTEKDDLTTKAFPNTPLNSNVNKPPTNPVIVNFKMNHTNKLKKEDDSVKAYRSASSQSLPAEQHASGPTSCKKMLDLLTNDPATLKEVALGKRVGFYQLGKELGAGNFSKVKLGVHCITEEKVAVKIMDKNKMDQRAQKLLIREIQTMEQLHHPNIIRFFECVETASRTFLIMEYASGGELYSYVHDKGKLMEADCKPIFAQIVSAVAHVHSKNIVHRDIKAENVIFSQPGWIKLADFGFSRQVNLADKLSTFCGSPPYAAPELFKDEEYYGPNVDVWAVGVLLYFMLVGNTPFRGETINDLKQSVLRGIYPLPDYISSSAQHALSRMLVVDPRKRSTIEDVKKMYFLKDCKFTKPYLQCSMVPEEKELLENPIARKVWDTLRMYGIDEVVIKDASPKGTRNAFIGIYRIVLHQAQREYDQRERNRIHNHQKLLKATRKTPPMMTARSKTCSLL